MVFILIHNDNVHGVYDTLDKALLDGWKLILQEALMPWTLSFYKQRHDDVAVGIGGYFIEQWDVATNKGEIRYMLGEKKEDDADLVEYVLDKYLKRHHTECETILKNWYKEILVNGKLPFHLGAMTYVDEFSK
jgi:hypothetical protein